MDAHISPSRSNVEAELHLLEVITTIINSVHTPLNIEHIGNVTLDALASHFHPLGACLHTADAIQQALHLLSFHVLADYEYHFDALSYIPYNSPIFIAGAYLHREALLIENVPQAVLTGSITEDEPLVMEGVLGYMCVPLWFGDQFEGTLTISFAKNISVHEPKIQAIMKCGVHIASALAHARLHSAVENERTRLRIILDQLPEGILITEVASGFISYANPAAEQLLGISLEVLVGTPLDGHLQLPIDTSSDGQTMAPWNFVVVRALSEETIKTQETLVQRPDGSTVITLCSSAPLFSEKGTLTGAVLVFQDISVQKSLEQQKNEFISMTSHELRTPITAIQGFAELLQMDASQQDFASLRSQRSLQQIVQQSQHLTVLIEEMLDLTRLEQVRFVVDRTPRNILKILANVVESFASTTHDHRIHLVLEELELTDTLLSNIDEMRMVQVFSNLISNAIKYSPANTEIEVGLHANVTSRELLVWVKDQGIGIPPLEIPQIFERFHRASTLSPSITGLGIGLYLVKEIVSRHNGRVWVESVEGHSSTFYVQLPLTSE